MNTLVSLEVSISAFELWLVCFNPYCICVMGIGEEPLENFRTVSTLLSVLLLTLDLSLLYLWLSISTF